MINNELPSDNKGVLAGGGGGGHQIIRAERTPLEGRKPELGLHGCAGIATLDRVGRLFNTQAFGRHWQGCLCREAMDGLQGLSDEVKRAIRERLVQYRDVLR